MAPGRYIHGKRSVVSSQAWCAVKPFHQTFSLVHLMYVEASSAEYRFVADFSFLEPPVSSSTTH